MPLVINEQGEVTLKVERPVISRLWVPPRKRQYMDADAHKIQRALMDTAPPKPRMSAGAR